MAVLHVTTPQPLQFTPALQESRVGPPVAVNINICRYPWFFNITFIYIIWVQYATDNISVEERVFAS